MTTASTIVIADDSVVIRAVVRDHLEAEGYVVHEAVDGPSAIAACLQFHPDAVLLDIEMPGLDGHEVLTRLKSDPASSDIPVVFLTGLATTGDLVAGLRAGAHDYLKKPFEPAELLARIGTAVQIKRLQDELRRRNDELDRMSRVDALTGLYNRRHLEEQLHRLGSQARRDATPLAVLILDVDNFKQVNDSCGHAGGDVVLRLCAARLRHGARAGDVIGRWGGEEFLVVFPTTTLDEAMATADRIRARIGDEPIAVATRKVTVTISGGCAADSTGNTDALLVRADDALYRAKAGGRNQIRS
ncbi:MAG: diguanylate cyclase [Ilumatobacteraceae bacterium]